MAMMERSINHNALTKPFSQPINPMQSSFTGEKDEIGIRTLNHIFVGFPI